MRIVEQFQQSLFFKWKLVAKWQPQSIWRSLFYLLCLLFLSSSIVSLSSFSKTTHLNYESLLKEMDIFTLTKNGLDYNGEPLLIPVPIFDTTLLISEKKQYVETKYVLLLKKKGFIFSKNGAISENLTPYANIPIWGEKNSYTNKDVLLILKKNNSTWKQLGFVYQYVKALLQVIITIFMVSLIALISIPFARNTETKFQSLWMFAAYSLTLPLAVMTVLKAIGFFIPYFTFIYWFSAIIFVFLTIIEIKKSS